MLFSLGSTFGVGVWGAAGGGLRGCWRVGVWGKRGGRRGEGGGISPQAANPKETRVESASLERAGVGVGGGCRPNYIVRVLHEKIVHRPPTPLPSRVLRFLGV